MTQIGYSLIDDAGSELQFWGDAPGQCAGVPNPIFLPDGTHVHAPPVGRIGDYRLVERHVAYGQSAVPPTFDGTKVVVTRVYTADDVRAEAQRRIILLTGARDLNGCIIKQLNALMRATELANIKASGGTLTAPQEAEATMLQALADAVKTIRAKSNLIEANPPTDYTSDAYWT